MDDSVAAQAREANAGGSGVVAVVLAAGAGERLRPLSELRPKALCPVGNQALLDLALARVAPVVEATAVNLHHGAAAVRDHLANGAHRDVHMSEEQPVALGTAGALGALRDWIDGRAVVVVNADAWSTGALDELLQGWDGRKTRLLLHGADVLGPRVGVVASLLPWAEVRRLRPEPSSLYEEIWRRVDGDGGLEVVAHHGDFVDCGTPHAYLAANLAAARLCGGSIVDPAAVTIDGVVTRSVVGAGAVVHGEVVDSVMWPGTVVEGDERLERAVRASDQLTVTVTA
jgi:NDP-sugar pyrophosphorylase family protein